MKKLRKLAFLYIGIAYCKSARCLAAKLPAIRMPQEFNADATHIIMGNDKKLPVSSSREPNQADNNELILLEFPESQLSDCDASAIELIAACVRLVWAGDRKCFKT
ncbi:hypothetical protein [Polaromonas sp.]|uniref:hypothetical protein n=1 Tax=Polaromonas sp. TaxID=1869339 RepID=UPI003C8C971E